MSECAANPAVADDAENWFRVLLDEVAAFVYTTDKYGRFTYANRLVLELLGQPLEALIGKDFSDFVDIGESGRLRETDRRVLEDGETITREESNWIHATGELRSYWSMKKPLRDADGAIIGMLGISHDITEKKRLEDKVREQKTLLDTILDHVDALVYMKGADRRFLYANKRVAEVFGCSVEHIIGSLDSTLMPAETADRFWLQDQASIASGRPRAVEEMLVDAQGRERHYWSVVVPWSGPDGSPAIIGMSTDITELHELKEELQRQARTDSLTNIANRRSLYEQAEKEIARSCRHGTPLSLIAIDLDHFKAINDRYGHAAGDHVLRSFADCCKEMLRDEDLFARTGGEEFCILLPESDLAAAQATAERIRTHMGDCCINAEHPELRISASFGVSTLDGGEQHFGSLFSRADHALYAAKQQGRNCTVVLRKSVAPAMTGARSG